MYEKLDKFSKKVSDLADTPSNNMTPAQIKEWFDTAPEEMRKAFNKLVETLNVEDSTIKSRLNSASQNLNTLNTMTTEQSQNIAELFAYTEDIDYKIAKASSNAFDYSIPISVSPSGIPYMFFITDDGVLGVEEQVPQKEYYQDYLVSPDGNKFQTFSENDGTLVVYKLT